MKLSIVTVTTTGALLLLVPSTYAQTPYPPLNMYSGVPPFGNPYLQAPGGNPPCNPYVQGSCSITQQPMDCTPYNGTCTAPETPADNPMTNPDTGRPHQIDFPQVFLRVAGLEHTFVSIKNKAASANTVIIEVTVEGRTPVTRTLFLQAGERVSERISGWQELESDSGGASVVITAQYAATAGIAMHPDNMATFWTGARILEGR